MKGRTSNKQRQNTPKPKPRELRRGKGSEPPRIGVPNNRRRAPRTITTQDEVKYIE